VTRILEIARKSGERIPEVVCPRIPAPGKEPRNHGPEGPTCIGGRAWPSIAALAVVGELVAQRRRDDPEPREREARCARRPSHGRRGRPRGLPRSSPAKTPRESEVSSPAPGPGRC
jgi:hypothetical protein